MIDVLEFLFEPLTGLPRQICGVTENQSPLDFDEGVNIHDKESPGAAFDGCARCYWFDTLP